MMHYYTEDGVQFHSKIKALEYSIRHDKKLNFYYHDEVYRNVQWKIEPVESLTDLYREQAQRIRDSYDYVILCYSGGYDSTNILETFYYNNIKLDKIVTVGALSQDSHSGVDENHNGELYHNVFPYLKELGLESITQVCDYTTFFDKKDVFTVTQHADDWIDYLGAWFSPHNWFWRDIEQYVVPRQYRDKKVALIFGKDKPILHHGVGERDTNLFPSGLNGFMFKDAGCTSYGNVESFENCDRINFYWDPNFTKIIVKQLHILYRAYIIDKSFTFDSLSGTQIFNNHTVNSLIYDLKKPILFKSPKSKTTALSLRDEYLKDKKDSHIYNLHQAGMKKLYDSFGTYRLPSISSKFYSIV